MRRPVWHLGNQRFHIVSLAPDPEYKQIGVDHAEVSTERPALLVQSPVNLEQGFPEVWDADLLHIGIA